MASVLKVDKLDPQSGTALEIGTSGDTITVPSGASLTLTDSTLSLPTTINTDKIDPKSGTALEIGSSGDTITIPSGATFTQSGTMNASAITAGTIATARLGSGTASSSTVLYGDQTYKAEPGGGKILQVEERKDLSNTTHSTDSYTATGIYDSITPSSTDSDIFVNINYHGQSGTGSTTGVSIRTAIFRDINGGGYSQIYPSATPSYTLSYSSGGGDSTERYIYSIQNQTFVDSPATTDVVTYKLYARRGTTGGSNAYIGSGQQQNVILMELDGS
jgi:hypothetical protein